MAGLTTYTDTDDSYAAGFSAARRDAATMDERQLRHIVSITRAYLTAESTNRFARAFAAGALDGLAPLLQYTEVA